MKCGFRVLSGVLSHRGGMKHVNEILDGLEARVKRPAEQQAKSQLPLQPRPKLAQAQGRGQQEPLQSSICKQRRETRQVVLLDAKGT